MMVLVDYNTKEELGPASYEMQERWNNRPSGTRFLEVFNSGFKRRVIIEERKREERKRK